MLYLGFNNKKFFFFKMFFIYVFSLILLASIICSNIVTNNYILEHIQHTPQGDYLQLLEEIYNRKSLIYDINMFNNTNNYISLKNIHNSFNIQCLNNRVLFYSSRFTSEYAWNRAAVSIFNEVNSNLNSYFFLLKNNPTPHTIKTCEVWAYVHLLDLQNK